jgi:hypothetical protein
MIYQKLLSWRRWRISWPLHNVYEAAQAVSLTLKAPNVVGYAWKKHQL